MEERHEGVLAGPPFPQGYRASGVLLHITSLPSRYGIGDLGPSAFRWVDLLHESGQRWWQALPLGPTGYGHSPYQSLSSFAANGLLLSPELLILDGLLSARDCEEVFPSTVVDYDAVIACKHGLLEILWNHFRAGRRKDLQDEFEAFCQIHAGWLDNYALFRALKGAHQNAYYLDWPEELVRREPAALDRARTQLARAIDQIRLAQFLVFRQFRALKDYAHARNVALIGDLPFFVSPDSSDVWANPELFLLDERRRPLVVAGVPPDVFSADGQLWGNPIYDWEAMRQQDYAWCLARIRALLAHVDVIRLDHFRAFAAAWHVPGGAPTACNGEWIPGPGAAFFETVRTRLGALPFIAEDLGVITPDVVALRDAFHIPGTRVLQFGFDDPKENVHLPEEYPSNAVVYTGTHDNPTTRGWFEDLPERDQRRVWAYLRQDESEVRNAAPELIRLAWSSRAALAITPFQDLLNVGREGRMNVPGRADGNWRWRATYHMLSEAAFAWLREVTLRTGRTEPLA